MESTASPTDGRLDRLAQALSGHSALGFPVRFYLRRREQLLYLAVGGWNTFFGYAVWAVMQFVLGPYLHYLVVVVLAWPIAVLNAYLGYRYVVFRSRGPILRELPRFSLVYLGGLLANLIALPIALRILPLNIYAIQALFTAVVIVSSFVAHKYYSFGGGRRRDTRTPASYDRTRPRP